MAGALHRRYEEAQRRRELRTRAINELGRFCSICMYDGLDCPSAMDFHHPDAAEKDFSISARMTSWEAIRAELAKCVLLCCRCHREVHDGRHPGYIRTTDDDRRGYDWDLA